MKRENRLCIVILVDSEYIANRFHQPISLFVKILKVKIDCRNHLYTKQEELFKKCYLFKQVIDNETVIDSELFHTINKPEEIFEDIYPRLLEYQQVELQIQCWYYFAPLDWQLLFWEFKEIILKNSNKRAVSNHKQIEIRNIKIKIKDISHLGGIGSLASKLKWMGKQRNRSAKQLGETLKLEMHKFLNQDPIKFYKYSENDVDSLYLLYHKTQKFFNVLYYRMRLTKQPMNLTTGANVQQLLQSVIQKRLKTIGILRKEWKETKLHNSLRKPEYVKKSEIKKLCHVLGGRCNNENPTEFFYKNMNDVDIKACYTFAMSTLLLPLVKFRILFNIKISDFLQTRNLSNYWAISFSTKTSFSQDFIGSTLTAVEKVQDDNEEITKKNKESVYLRKEIVDGVLTHKTLETMRRYYKEEEVTEILEANGAEIFYYLEEDLKESIKLELFLSELKQIKEDKKGGLSQMAKLLLNATYGTLCSIYMDVANVLIAQMITAIARSWIYIIHKELNTPVSITDGTFTHLDKETIFEKLKNEQFEITIKHKTPIRKMIVFGKSNYFYNLTFKMRGLRNTKGTPHELFYKKILPAIAQEKTPPPLQTRMTIQHHIYSLSAYKYEQKLKGFKILKTIPLGYTRPHVKNFTITNNHIAFDYLEEYKENKLITSKKKNTILPSSKGLHPAIVLWADTYSDLKITKVKFSTIVEKANLTLSKIIFDNTELIETTEHVGILRNIYIPKYSDKMVLIQDSFGLKEKYANQTNIEIYITKIYVTDFSIGSFEFFIYHQITKILTNLDQLTYSIEVHYPNNLQPEKIANIETTVNLLRREFFQILETDPTEILKTACCIDKNIQDI